MLKTKAEQSKKATPHADVSLKRKTNHPVTSRSDIFSKLVKLVGLSDSRGSKAVVDRCEATGGPGELVALGCPPEHSPVTLHFSSTTSLPTSSSKETLRSSSDSNLAVSAQDDGSKQVQGTDLSSLIHTIDGSRSKHERKSTRRKAKTTPLSEPATFLATIPEIASVFERNPPLPDLSFSGHSKYYPSEDALMDTDSIRARTAIALARAQLEHSRPASHNRKIERSSNQMMMLPNELEEFKAQTRLRSATIPARADSSVWNEKLINPDRDINSIRKEVEQSQAMVLTLMAAKEVKSQRATRKKSHSPPRVDLPKLPNKPSQGLYQAGDIPPCPPPSIPLPRLPPSIPLPQLPPRITVTGHKSEPTTPKLEQFRRNEASSSSSAYKGLPTVYRSDDETLKHIDLLMQSLLDSHPDQEDHSRKFCHSLPSRSGRGRSGSHSAVDSGRQSRRPRITIPSEPMPVQRPAGRTPVTSPPQPPHTPAPRAYCELRFGTLPGPAKMPHFKPISFNCYDVLPPSTEDGMLSYSEHDAHSQNATCNLTFSSGPTGKYSQ